MKGKRKAKAAIDEPRRIKDEVCSSSVSSLSVSTMEKTLKTKKKRSIKMPGSIVCKGCRSVIGEGVKVNTIKSIVGELRKYKIRCPGCGYKIVLERTFGDNEYIITEGAVFDWAGWRKKRSEEYFERVAPGSYVRDLDVFKTFHIALMVGNPLTDGPYQAI